MTTYDHTGPHVKDDGTLYWNEFDMDCDPPSYGGVSITIEQPPQPRPRRPYRPITLSVMDDWDEPYAGLVGLTIREARVIARMLLSAADHAEGTTGESPMVEPPAGEPGPDITPEVLPVVADDKYLPTRAHPSDAGLDLRARALVRLHPGIRTAIPTGVQVAIPEGHVGYITPRSGLAARHGLTVLNAPGTIDAGYRGEIEVLLVNHGREVVEIEQGARIAQLVIHPIITPEVKLVDALPATERGEGGFGSTGA